MATRHNRARRRARWKELRPKLERLRPILERQGSVRERVPRRGSGLEYVVRFRGPSEADPTKQVHRSVYIGRDALLAHGVRCLLQRWQALALAQKLEQAWNDFFAGAIAASKGYGRDATREFKARVRAQVRDPSHDFLNTLKCEEGAKEEVSIRKTTNCKASTDEE